MTKDNQSNSSNNQQCDRCASSGEETTRKSLGGKMTVRIQGWGGMITEDHFYSHPLYFKCSSRTIIKPMTFRIKLQPSGSQICSMLVMNTTISPTTETIPEQQNIGLITQVKDDTNTDIWLHDRSLCIYTHISVNFQTFLCLVHEFRDTVSCPFWKEIPNSLTQISCCANMEQVCDYKQIHGPIQAYHSASQYLEVQNQPLISKRSHNLPSIFSFFSFSVAVNYAGPDINVSIKSIL